jgi:hypothetical protein
MVAYIINKKKMITRDWKINNSTWHVKQLEKKNMHGELVGIEEGVVEKLV